MKVARNFADVLPGRGQGSEGLSIHGTGGKNNENDRQKAGVATGQDLSSQEKQHLIEGPCLDGQLTFYFQKLPYQRNDTAVVFARNDMPRRGGKALRKDLLMHEDESFSGSR